MSRVGSKPIVIPAGVDLKVNGQTVTVKGPLGEMTHELPERLAAKVEGQELLVSRTSEDKTSRAMHGTTRSLVANMVEGVSKGFTRELELQGVGYRAQQQGAKVILNLGFSHSIEYEAPEGVTIDVTDATKLKVTGVDKQRVGLASARIRALSPAEPYKGKGVRYKGEKVRRKAGKTVA